MAVEEVLDLKLSTDDAKKVATMVNTDVRTTRFARQQMDQKIAGAWERYEGKPPSRDLPFREAANFRTPLTMWIMDGIWVRVMRTVFGQLPYLRVQDQDQKGAPAALPIQVMLQHLAETDLALRFNGGQVALNALVEGTGILKLNRDEQTRTIRDRPAVLDLVSGTPADTLVERTIMETQGLTLDVVDLKDFWVANAAIVDVNRQPWVAHRVWLTWDQIVRRQADGIYKITKDQLDRIKPLAKRRQTTDVIGALDLAKANIDQAELASWPTVKEYEIIEAEWQYDLDDSGKTTECMFSVAVGFDETPLRAQKNPFWNGKRNYVLYRPLPRANRAYGRSMALIMLPIQDEADARLNQDLDSTTLSVLAGLTPILPKSAKREWEKHRWRLLEPIYVDTPEQFKTLAQVVGNIRQQDPQLAQLFQIAERVSGMSDPQLGKPVAGTKTAFEIATVQSEGNIKFSEMVEQIQISNRDLGYLAIEHAYQMSLEAPSFAQRLTRVAGTNPFQGVDMATIRRRWGIVPTGNTIVANREIEAKKWMNVYMLLKDDPFVNANPLHAYYLRVQLLETAALAGYEIAQLLGTDQEIQMFAEAMLRAKAAQGDLSAQVQLAAKGGAAPGSAPGELPQSIVPGQTLTQYQQERLDRPPAPGMAPVAGQPPPMPLAAPATQEIGGMPPMG